MEELQNSHLRNRTGVSLSRKIPNGNAQSGYDDVFGGPPRFSAPFATRFDDYAEIFGGLSSSCSIPVLDLPPAIDGGDAPVDARSSGFDYSEIFGGFDAGAFAISYEELFSVPKRPEDPSSNERVSKETDFSQQVKEISEFSSEGPSEDHIAYSETDQISSDSHYSNDGSKQFNMSYHKTSRGSKEDVINGTTHVTQLHAVPGFTFLVDACSPLQKITSDNPPEMATNDTSFSVNLNGGVTDGRKWNIFPPTSSGASTNSSENDLKADQKQFPTKHPTSGDGLANVNRHSRSSSNQSASSGDIPNPDGTFVSVFDISLRTQPLRVPPPSRPPPKLVTKHGHTKNNSFANPKNGHDEERLCRPMTNHQTQYSGSASKSHTIQDAVKDSSPQFFDVEVDASSAAAASAAAMKEAMEQAQARLKSAKESMERKRDNLKSHKNLGHREGVKGKERKEDRAAHEVQSIPEETAQKIFEKEDRKMNDFTMEERQKAKREAKVASDHEEKDRHLVSAEEDRQTVQGKESRSSQVSNKLERAGEWKIDNQFYELINNEKKFKTVQEVSEQEGSEKKLKKMTKVNEDKGNESKVTKLANESKDNGRSCVGNEACEWKENDKELKAGNLAGSEEEIKEIAKAIPEACVQEENDNKLEDAIDSYQREDNEKTLKEAREARFCEVEEKKSDAAEEACADGEREIKLKTSNEACKLEEAHEHEEEEKKSEAVKKARGCEKEPNATFEAPQSEKKLKRANKAIMQDEDEKVFEVLHGSWMFEVREKMKASQEASQYVDFEKTRGVSKLAYDREENENELKATNVATEQEESKKLNGIPEAYGWVENEKKLRVAQEAVELEENEKKSKATKVAMGHTENKANLKAAQEAVGDAEDKKKLQAAKQDCQQDCNEKKASEAQLELLQNEKKSKAANVPCDLENSEKKLTTAEGDYGQRENGSFKEVRGALDSEKNNNRFITTQDECQMVESEGLEPFREDFALDEKGNRLALDATKSCGTGATDSTVPDMPKSAEREKEGRMEREREREKELARKLEEEKEREREREKDRLAVERATREARERALSEARERAERIAVERVTAEARQRALAEAREKAEKASAEALEKSIAEKATREARLRAERAAVERATAEARERAVERAMAEKVASEARERAERFSSTSRDRMRKDNEAEGYFRASDKEDSGTRLKPSSSDFQDVAQFQSTGFSSSNSHRYSDSHNQASYSNGKLEGTENESALRCKARLERHQRTVERAAKALAEKNIRDILAQREQAERNRLAESLDADVRRWSNGKEGNLRALLSTLQYILGSESGWQPIPLTDVITAAAVKKAYRKATLCVHPDKLQQRGASIQQKYICEKVFDLLKEAWNRFNSEER